MSIEHLEAPPTELASLFATEARDLPPVAAEVGAAIFERVGRTLGWGGPSGGGAAGAGVKLATLLVAALGLVGLGALVYSARDAGPTESGPHDDGTTVGAQAVHPSQDAAELPAWFGDPLRPERRVAGQVVYEGQPVAGARVVLQSYASRAGVVPEDVMTTDASGRFDFGSRRATTHDVTASAEGMGYAHERLNLQDPTGSFDDVVLELAGCDVGVSGVVRDASGGVIVGAEVSPGRGIGNDITTVGVAAMTDEQGHYSLCAGRGPLTLIVSADGYGAVVIEDYATEWMTLDAALLPAATIVGRVIRASDGTPVREARVWLNPADTRGREHTYGAVASTDSDGRFRMEGVAPGRHWLWADARPMAASGSVIASPAAESREVVLSVEDLGGVTGRVMENGRPVPGASVGYTINGQRRGGTDTTDADGRFALYSSGRSVVSFHVVGYQVVTPTSHLSGDVDEPVTVVVTRGARLVGRVTAAGQPVAGAVVNAFSGDDLAVTAVSDHDGQFTISGLASGAYRLQAHSERLQAFMTQAFQPTIAIAAGAEQTGLVLELDGAAAIEGTVLDEAGQPVASAVVKYADATNDQCRATTRADGTFSCTMIAGGGTYRPTVRPAAGARTTLPATEGELPTAFVESRTSEVTGVVLRVRLDRQHIRGRVVAKGGGPVPDVHVRALSSAVGYTPSTAPWVGFPGDVSGPQGEFDIEVWGREPYTLHARAPDGGDGVSANVQPGADDVILALTLPGSVTGTLAGFTSRPFVWVRPVGDTEEHLLAVVEHDRFSIDGLAPGRYGILAYTPREAAGAMIEVRPGETVNVDLKARPTAPLAIRVVDFVTGAPVPGTHCVALPYLDTAGVFGLGVHANGPTDEAGSARIDAPTGAIEVTCLPLQGVHAGGAVRANFRSGDSVEATIPVVTALPRRTADIGARFLFSHREPSGHNHTIAALTPGSPAAAAELQVGDIIVAIDGRDVTPLIAIDQLLAQQLSGKRIGVVVERKGRRLSIALMP